jgi:hypothetical protein
MSQILYIQGWQDRLTNAAHADHDVNIYSYKTTVHNNQCTYLNSSLLMAPREYVLYGLFTGID